MTTRRPVVLGLVTAVLAHVSVGALAQSPPPPRVTASPSSLDFRWQRTSLALTLKNTSSGSVTVQIESNVAWASPAVEQVTLAGFESKTVAINASRAGLASGTYAGQLTLQEQTSPSPPPTSVDLSIIACRDVATFVGKSDTEKFQAALDSDEPCILVSVKNNGAPWIVGPLTLTRSNKQIYFESGVVVQAKSGAFAKQDDCLLKVNQVTDLVLEGDPNVARPVLRMLRDEYIDGGSGDIV